DVIPVHKIIEPGFEIFRTRIAIVDVVGVLPHVDTEQRNAAMHQGVFPIRRFRYFQLSVLPRQPRPARAELSGASSEEVFAELVEATEVGIDSRLKFTRKRAPTAIWLHPLPEVDMIVML